MAEVVLFKELYSWQNDHDQGVFVDGANGLVIYQSVYDKSLRVIDSCRSSNIFDSIRFSKPLCESILFSSDGQYILFWHNNPLAIGIIDTTNPASSDIIVDSSSYEETIVLNVFWSQCSKSSAEFVVACTTCIDIYSFTFRGYTLRRLCSKRISCSHVWNDLGGTYLVVLKSNNVLQPYRIISKEVRPVTDVELSVRDGHKLQRSAITVVTIYGSTYCVYKDFINGMVSLRSLTDSKAVDIVLELKCQGWLDIAVFDNLIFALTGGNETYIFDIAMKDRALLARVPQRKPCMSSISSDVQVFIPNVVVDSYGGFVYNLTLDHNMLMLVLLQSHSEALIADFYQRRQGSIQRVIEIVNSAMSSRINQLGTRTANNVSIPFNLVEEHIGDRSILTEYRFGNSVLYPYICHEWNVSPNANIFDFTMALLCHHYNFDFDGIVRLRDSIVLEPPSIDNVILKSKIASGGNNVLSGEVREYLSSPDGDIPALYDSSVQDRPYIISVLLSYFRALISFHLQPTHMLQVLLFDMCILYNCLDVALHLIRCRVIHDSIFLCYRMLFLYAVLRDRVVRQQCLDMCVRLKAYDLCISIFMLDRDYYGALVCIRTYRLLSFPLYRILYEAAIDVDAQTRKLHSWPSIISFVRRWVEDCGPTSGPNLQGCEMWLPNL
eukprot:XP_001612139.1 hypothetical protein [Babesia bovis T2Bo]